MRGGRGGFGWRGSRGSRSSCALAASACTGLLRGSLRSRLPPPSLRSPRAPRSRRLLPPSVRSPRSGRGWLRGLFAVGGALGCSASPSLLSQPKSLPKIDGFASSAFIGAGCAGVIPCTTACARVAFCCSCAAVSGFSSSGFSTSI